MSKTQHAAETEGAEDIEETVDPSPGRAPEGEEPPENFLAMYFRDMASLTVLEPEEECRAAERIWRIEVDLWTAILAYPPVADLVLDLMQRQADSGIHEISSVRRLVRATPRRTTRSDRQRHRARCERLARIIHSLDVDRKLLCSLVGELKLMARDGTYHRFGRAWGPRRVRSRAFEEHRRRVLSLFAASQRARNEFIKANLRLVVSIARRFNLGRMPLADLIQEGNIGLIKAVERFDYRRGYRFSTYASWWIRHSISRALADKGRAVRLPVHMLDAYNRVSRTSRELGSKLGRQPTADEIGCVSRLSLEKVEKMQGYLLDQSLSLDRQLSDQDDRCFVEMLQDPDAMAPAERLLDRSVTEQVQKVMVELKPIEVDVLHKRFGLDGTEEQTLKQIGERYQLSRERIRQIQEQALDKIRRALQRQEAV